MSHDRKIGFAEILQRFDSNGYWRPFHWRNTESELANLLNSCFLPVDERPSLKQVKTRMKAIRGYGGNVVERIMNKLEEHAANLQDTINERTQQLIEERRKADALLEEMLPRYIAAPLLLQRIIFISFQLCC